VDDEESIRDMIGCYFSGRGFQVVSSRGLEEAEAMLSNGGFDCLIADLRLTNERGMEGLELITFVRKHSPDTKVILLTACADSSVHEEARHRGADLVLEKPQLLPAVAAALDTLMNRAS
jgi:DNA-binding response OmpR family regulator